MEKVVKVTVGLEVQLMKHYPDTKKYLDKARSLIFNLKDKNNTWLRESLINGSLEAKRAVTMEAKELASESKKTLREQTI